MKHKLRLFWRLVVLVCAVMVIAMTMLLWSATGKAGYTRFFDPQRAQRDAQAAQGSIEDLFADAGAEIEALPEVENRFALGLAPSGPGKHLVSVITIAGPALVIAIGSLASLGILVRRRSDASESADTAATEDAR